MNYRSPSHRKLFLVFLLVLIGSTPSWVGAQSLTIPELGSTLTWTLSGTSNSCGPMGHYEYTETNFTAFQLHVGSAVYPLSGSDAWFVDSNPEGCPPSGGQQTSLGLPPSLGLPTNCNIVFTATSANGSGTEALLGCGFTGILYPKYVVEGVTYAPPGAGSSVNYIDTTSIGTTKSYSTSFSDAVGYSVENASSGTIPAGTTGISGTVGLTSSNSTTYTQTSSSTNSVTLNKSVSIGYSVNGYATTIAPNGPPSGTVTNDYDTIQVWLNAELLFTAYPAMGSNPLGYVAWNGYAYDPNDMAEPDIYPVQVGCLNGHIAANLCTQEQGVMNRGWVVGEKSPTSGDSVAAPGCPNASSPNSPSICPNTQDAFNILAADPFASYSGAPVYAGLNGYIPFPPYTYVGPLPTETADGRFTQLNYVPTTPSNPANPIAYEPGYTPTDTLVQMNTEASSNNVSDELMEKTVVSVNASVKFLGVFTQSINFTYTDTMTSTNTWLNSLTTSQTITDGLKIVGPSAQSYTLGEIMVFQDNTYGTFMFVPWN